MQRDHDAFARAVQGTGIHLFGRLMLQIYREYSERMAAQFAAMGHAGVTIAHVPVFTCVEVQGTRISTLAERTGTTKQYMGRLVGDLVDKGYLTRVRDPEDGRAMLVRVTERGYQLMDDIEQGKNLVETENAARLGAAKMEHLVALLEELAGPMPFEWVKTAREADS